MTKKAKAYRLRINKLLAQYTNFTYITVYSIFAKYYVLITVALF